MSPTQKVIFGTVLFLCGWDVYAILTYGEREALSYRVQEFAYAYPIITFAAGLLCGHWFWALSPPTK